MHNGETTHNYLYGDGQEERNFGSSCEQDSSNDSGGGQHGGGIGGGDGRRSSNGGDIRDGSNCSNGKGDG